MARLLMVCMVIILAAIVLGGQLAGNGDGLAQRIAALAHVEADSEDDSAPEDEVAATTAEADDGDEDVNEEPVRSDEFPERDAWTPGELPGEQGR